MTFARLRSIVDSLKYKYRDQLTVYRARPHAEDLCDQMAEAVTPGTPRVLRSTDDWAFGLFEKLRDRDLPVKQWWKLAEYLDTCLEKRVLPQVNDVLRTFFPRAREKGLIPRTLVDVPFEPRTD